MKKRISMSRAGRRLPALVRIMQLISEIVINQNSKYAEKKEIIYYGKQNKLSKINGRFNKRKLHGQ